MPLIRILKKNALTQRAQKIHVCHKNEGVYKYAPYSTWHPFLVTSKEYGISNSGFVNSVDPPAPHAKLQQRENNERGIVIPATTRRLPKTMSPLLRTLSLLLVLAVSEGFTGRQAFAPRSKVACAMSSETATSNVDVVKVDLSDGRDYPIYIGTGYSDEQVAEMLTSHIEGSKALLVTNDRIAPMYLEKYEKLVAQHKEVCTLVLPDGEEEKTMEILQRILDKALEEKLDRKCTFLALGGGVIGDMVGFAAAIYQRGVNFIQIPTTVMAMVDSSVGGKDWSESPARKEYDWCLSSTSMCLYRYRHLVYLARSRITKWHFGNYQIRSNSRCGTF